MAPIDGNTCNRRDAPVGPPRLRGLLREHSGHALVEFALIFPIMLGLFLGVSEFSEAFTVSRRLQSAASTAADLVARMHTVQAQDLDGVKSMMDELVKPYSLATLGVVFTGVIADAKDASITTVQWSATRGTGVTPHALGVSITLPSGLMLPNTSIVLAEVKYSFQSTLSTMIIGTVPMHAEAYQRPRFALTFVQ